MTSEDAAAKQSISNASIGDVNGSEIDIRQSSVGSITAERASVHQASLKSLDTRSAQLDQSSVFRLNAEQAVINQSAATFVNATDVRLVKSNAVLVRGTSTTVEGDLKTVVFAGNATGNVHMIFDREGALRFGAGLGAALVVLGLLVRKLFR